MKQILNFYDIFYFPHTVSFRSWSNILDGPRLMQYIWLLRMMSHAEQCRNGDESPESVGLLPTDKDMSTAEPEAIVVGAVGTGAPWFLTGWPEGTEVDTGCQVTILETLVFERICVGNTQIGARLQPCNRRFVSADSSPLSVRGELCMTIVFPGLQCDMMLVIASIRSEGLLGTKALQSCLSHQLDLGTRQLWADGQSTLQLHQQRQAVRVSAYTQGSLVVPPDSEIEPTSEITESYGVLVGRTLVDTSNWQRCW